MCGAGTWDGTCSQARGELVVCSILLGLLSNSSKTDATDCLVEPGAGDRIVTNSRVAAVWSWEKPTLEQLMVLLSVGNQQH
jgi:hypothetical protein